MIKAVQPKRADGVLATLVGVVVMASAACGRSAMMDLPLWRVELDAAGREFRVVQLPFEQASYDMRTNALVRDVQDRNQDGVADRIITYEGRGGARLEESDTDFDGNIDLWETFAADGRRLRSASARFGNRPDRIATYDAAGLLARVEVDSNLDGRPELIQIFEGGRLAENQVDSDGNGLIDRRQDFRKGYLSVEEFDTDEDGTPDLRMTYAKDGSLLKAVVLNPNGRAPRK